MFYTLLVVTIYIYMSSNILLICHSLFLGIIILEYCLLTKQFSQETFETSNWGSPCTIFIVCSSFNPF